MSRHKGFFPSSWHLIIAIVAVMASVYIPLQIIFRFHDLNLFGLFEVAVTLLFTADLLFYQFSLRRIRDEFYPHIKVIPWRHRLFWFLGDLLAALPLGLMFSSPLWLCLRLLKLMRVAQYMHRWRQNILRYSDFLKLAFFAFWFCILTHWLTCGWLALAADFYKADPLTNYLSALHWVIETLTSVGFGETIPASNSQRGYSIILMLAGVGVYGYVIGNVAGILAKRDPAKTQYFSNLDQLTAFVQYRDIPLDLQKRIRDYYAYIWKKRLGFDETTFLSGLPRGLQNEVSRHLKFQILEKIPLFSGVEPGFIEEVALNLKPDVYTPGEYVFKIGQAARRMYFVIRGRLEVLNKEGKIVNTLKDGDFFGEIALFTDQPRTASIRTLTYCDLYILDKDVFEYLLERFPDIGSHIRQVAQKRLSHDAAERT
jgi:voltage-gated potassium channel